MSDTPTDTTYLFAQNALPPMQSGRFTLTITQTLANGGTTLESFTRSQVFDVAGARFRLDPSVVDSAYPPAGAQGDFGAVLPHLVLNELTLPWQRSPGGSVADGTPVNPPPWMALLVFDEGDPAPTPKTLTVGDLQNAPAGTWCPAPQLEAGQAPTDPVTVIDVPLALFDTIAPSAVDLGWLAHTRTVPVGAKPTQAGAPAPGAYAVVFANRFPMPGRSTRVHLVSLEGWGDALPPDLNRGSDVPADVAATSVRLVTLYSWTFMAVAAKQTFGAVVGGLDASAAGMQLPAPGGTCADAVRTAFGLGYTALGHSLRDGTPAVSWYRGPFLPVAVPELTPPPARGPDDLLRYDPTSGMFDVSYAAAWQLGQLMALHDSTVSAALYRLKNAAAQQSAIALETAAIDAALSGLAGGASGSVARTVQLLKSVVAPVVLPLAAGPAQVRTTPGGVAATRPAGPRLRPAALAAALATPTASLPEGPDLTLVRTWLAAVGGFAGVPFHHLAPDAGMLPVESIRLFQVDINWLNALLDGALSVGGPATADFSAELLALRREALAAAPGVRAAALGQVAPSVAQSRKPSQGTPGMSGFLMRSAAVSGWPGLQVTAYADAAGQQPLPTVRLERLAPTLLLGLFQGTLARVDLGQPSETLFFGAELSGGAVTVPLRYANGAGAVAAGSAVGLSAPLPVRPATWTLPGGGAANPTTGNGTLRMDALAGAIAGSVWATEGQPPTLTSAEFGLQFVQDAETVSFQPTT